MSMFPSTRKSLIVGKLAGGNMNQYVNHLDHGEM